MAKIQIHLNYRETRSRLQAIRDQRDQGHWSVFERQAVETDAKITKLEREVRILRHAREGFLLLAAFRKEKYEDLPDWGDE